MLKIETAQTNTALKTDFTKFKGNLLWRNYCRKAITYYEKHFKMDYKKWLIWKVSESEVISLQETKCPFLLTVDKLIKLLDVP